MFTNKRTENGMTYFTLNCSKSLPHPWSIRNPKFVNATSNIRISEGTTIKIASDIDTRN